MREPLEYHQLHRLGRPGVWRPLVGAPLLFLATFALVPYALSRFFELDLDNVTPSTLVFVNLVLASAIPIAILVNLALHGLGPGWLMSVAHRIRWRFLLGCLGLSVVALLATVIVSALVPQSVRVGPSSTGEVNSFTSTTRDFLLVVLILTPLQAAGEEFVFRGYLMQAFGEGSSAAGWWPSCSPRCCSPSRTASARTCRSSSTDSPSDSSPARW